MYTDHEKLRKYGEDLERSPPLRTSPIALRLLKGQEEVPEGTFRPKRDKHQHLALCQAFALARREGIRLAMFKEDHWCFEPLITYGLVEPPKHFLEGLTSYPFFIADKDAASKRAREVPMLPFGTYEGILLGPLRDVNFDPHLVIIYCRPSQLRHLLLSVRYKEGYLVASRFDPIGSCTHAVIPSFLTKECTVSVPDPGDFERACTSEDEIIFTVPFERLEDLMVGLCHFEGSGRGYRRFSPLMRPDFPQPPFYKEFFRAWGLDAAEEG
ncbi:MAG: DUF169 domain-containing protein [Candidatus Bathyarchaeia archaeon]